MSHCMKRVHDGILSYDTINNDAIFFLILLFNHASSFVDQRLVFLSMMVLHGAVGLVIQFHSKKPQQ